MNNIILYFLIPFYVIGWVVGFFIRPTIAGFIMGYTSLEIKEYNKMLLEIKEKGQAQAQE